MAKEPRRPQAETEHKPEWDHGVEPTPHRVIEDGILVCPENKGYYDGWNQPWRM